MWCHNVALANACSDLRGATGFHTGQVLMSRCGFERVSVVLDAAVAKMENLFLFGLVSFPVLFFKDLPVLDFVFLFGTKTTDSF